MINTQVNYQKGGAEEESACRRKQITEWEGDISISGTAYYVSPKGKTGNSGISPESPLQTVADVNSLNLQRGDAVLFERGGVYRTEETLVLKSGVSYGAYGIGEKPLISGSAHDYAMEGEWERESDHIWSISVSGEAGVMTFDNDTAFGIRRFSIEDLKVNGEYYHDLSTQKLYLYYDGQNPSEVFDNIEIGTTKNLLQSYNSDSISIQNLALKYTGMHGISFAMVSNISIHGCEIGWVGGRVQNGDRIVQLGNAIEFWHGCHNVNVSHCYIYQIYDAAFTFQGKNTGDGNSFTDIKFTDSLIEYCSMNFEFWATDTEEGPAKGELEEIKNIMFKNNILRFSGYGWGSFQRADIGSQAFILGWNNTYKPGTVSEFYIIDNIFDCADSYFIWSGLIPEMLNNTYYQKQPSGRNSYIEVMRGSGKYAADQSSFESAVSLFEVNPAKVEWLQ